MLKRLALAVLFLSVFILQGCFEDKNTIIKSDKFILNSLKNKVFTVTKTKDGFKVNELENKIIIFDIFATWCPPCQKAALHLSSLQKKYKKEVVVIGLSMEEYISKDKLQEFKKVYGADYILLNDTKNKILSDSIVESLGLGNTYPVPIVVIYKDGKYITHYVGSVEEEFVESDIKRVLDK